MSRRDRYSNYDNYLAIKMRQLNCCTIKGDQGDVGPIGPKGLKGAQGATGAQGAQGQKGDAGDGIDLANWIFAVDDPIDKVRKVHKVPKVLWVHKVILDQLGLPVNMEVTVMMVLEDQKANPGLEVMLI